MTRDIFTVLQNVEYFVLMKKNSQFYVMFRREDTVRQNWTCWRNFCQGQKWKHILSEIWI